VLILEKCFIFKRKKYTQKLLIKIKRANTLKSCIKTAIRKCFNASPVTIFMQVFLHNCGNPILTEQNLMK